MARPEQIAVWEQAFDIAPPQDLRRLLEFSNGPALREAKTENELQFFAAEDAPEYYKDRHFGEWLPEGDGVNCAPETAEFLHLRPKSRPPGLSR